ncbi:MAG TPA: aquaporin, partial [Gemmatimonadaceae bacterium]|nr:aquaporin [Gemmatimonadaceae bacterium]
HALRHFLAEFLGTFALVFIGGLSIMMASGTGAPASIALIVVALAHGLVYAVMVSSLMRISGHFNPAVTIGLIIARRLEGYMAGIYVAAQVIGSIVAAYLLKIVVPIALFTATRGGGQVISLDITGTQAFIIEAVATFFLVWVVFGTAVDPKAPRMGGLAIGLTVTANMLAILPLTGGSMNPARSLGPAVATGIFEGQIVFWTAPLVGGALAALLYDQLFIRRGDEPVDHGAIEME